MLRLKYKEQCSVENSNPSEVINVIWKFGNFKPSGSWASHSIQSTILLPQFQNQNLRCLVSVMSFSSTSGVQLQMPRLETTTTQDIQTHFQQIFEWVLVWKNHCLRAGWKSEGTAQGLYPARRPVSGHTPGECGLKCCSIIPAYSEWCSINEKLAEIAYMALLFMFLLTYTASSVHQLTYK